MSRALPLRNRQTLAGVRWKSTTERPRAVQQRVRRRGSGWSEWLESPVADAHAPERSARLATEPTWIPKGDFVQFRVAGGPPKGLYAAFVGVDRRPRAVAARATRLGAAPNGVTPPPIFLRDSWDDGSAGPRREAVEGFVHVVIVHHTVGPNTYAPDDSLGIVLGIARYHRDHNGWDDIGYNLLVDRYGQVFEGRAGGLERAIVGAHAQGWNSQSTGIACLGTFGGETPPTELVETLARLTAWKLSVHGVPVAGTVFLRSGGGSANRYRRGTEVEFARIAGHGDADLTECPGAALGETLGTIRARAARFAPKAVEPPQELTITRQQSHVAAGERAVVSGRAPSGATVRLAVARRARGAPQLASVDRPRPVRARSDGRWSARLLLPRPGLYRIAAGLGDEQRSVYVRAVRVANGGTYPLV